MDNNLLQHENLTVFKQFGFVPGKVSGINQVQGTCPFCGGKNKFFVNPDSKKWDCKSCGKDGGYQTFIKGMFEESLECDQSELEKLAEHRGLKVESLQRHKVGYLSVSGKYVVPHLIDADDRIADLRLYNMKELHSTQGCQPTLMNYTKLVFGDYPTIFLCEGEWDCIAMDEILEELGMNDCVATGVPGAQTFKPEWIPFFRNKKVFVIYDNDYPREVRGKEIRGAGELGSKKVYGMLSSVVESIKFVHWPEKTKDGFDLRDFYHLRENNAKRTLRGIYRLAC